jgi:RimJ/RimL family protein N-acetyltransferase
MNFTESYQLENSCVLLQPLQRIHAENLLHFALEEPEIWIYSLVPVAGEQNLQNYISQALDARSLQKEYPFAVFDKRTSEYAGSTRFYDIQVANKVLQLGYTWYGKKFQGTGLNKHCKYLLLEFAFEKLGMERVEFRADNNNTRSVAAMKSIGCKVDGVLRSNMPMPNGGRRDSIVLSILKPEWEQTVKADLFAKLNW